MAADMIHQAIAHQALAHETLIHQAGMDDGAIQHTIASTALAHETLDHDGLNLAATPAPGPSGNAPDFSHISPNSSGVPDTGVMFTIAQVTLYVGLALCFLVALWELITWAVGHKFAAVHVAQQAKGNLVRVMVVGIALTVAGGLWSWITSLH